MGSVNSAELVVEFHAASSFNPMVDRVSTVVHLLLVSTSDAEALGVFDPWINQSFGRRVLCWSYLPFKVYWNTVCGVSKW